jgi:hypothetical protein
MPSGVEIAFLPVCGGVYVAKNLESSFFHASEVAERRVEPRVGVGVDHYSLPHYS